MHMESRKVQLTRTGSFIITLPKKWSEKMGLKKGDRVTITMDDSGTVVIYPPTPKIGGAVAILYVEDYPDVHALEKHMQGYYMCGVDRIIITSKRKTLGADLKSSIKSTLPNLIGVEVMEDLSDRLTLYVVLDPKRLPFRSVLANFFSLVLSMHEDLINALRSRDKELARDIANRYDEALRFYRLIVREAIIISKHRAISAEMGIDSAEEIILDAVSSRDLTRLAYHIAMCAKALAEFPFDKASPELEDTMSLICRMTEVILKMHKLATEAFNNKDFHSAVEAMKLMVDVRRMYDEILLKITESDLKGEPIVKLLNLLYNLRRAAGHVIAVADNTILLASDAAVIRE